MYKRYCATKSNNFDFKVEIFFSLLDYEEFKKNNEFDFYMNGAWEIYKCDIIHSYISTIPEQYPQLIIEVDCPLQGRSRGLYLRDEHHRNFDQCGDCQLPWLLTNFSGKFSKFVTFLFIVIKL